MGPVHKRQPGQRGTAIWALNRYREDALTSLMDDLIELEADGLPDGECQLVRRALERGANEAAGIPDGRFKTILAAFERLVSDYDEWNRNPATADDRRRRLRRLRKTRHLLANRIRKNAHVLEGKLDLEIVDAQYAALDRLIRALPEKLPRLAKAVGRFAKRAAAATH